ncbi:class I SAM-dependent methyltransferase [Gandjariella thermophila]|uniref:Methyltransferase type 11 domain-containing protein n=1 Tax=Gandjariella thermophila TaxID=1931992 RepID=A0A4D4JDR7_9PSEU|nr:class I SAM-dependent methyltransferase [Gandjariella thermophila]GDY32047.1 hypothetical protein GTS_36800 [Gandjariella thermophila]
MALTYWERVATSRWGSYITAEEDRAIRWASEMAGNPRHALEIGCDGGRWARMLSQEGWSVTCTDVAEEAIKLCADRVPDARCIKVDPADTFLPAEDASTSLVLCIEVLAVVGSDWFHKEVVRVLAPGGMLVATTWNRNSARGVAANLASRWRRRGPHSFYRTRYTAWRRQLLAAGLEVQSELGLCWFPFGRSSNSPLVPIAAMTEKRLGLARMPALSPWVLVTARKP